MVRTATPCRPPRPLRRHPRQQHRRRRLRPPRPPQPHPVWTTCSAPSRWTSITRRCRAPPETGSVFRGPRPGRQASTRVDAVARGGSLCKICERKSCGALWDPRIGMSQEGALAALAGPLPPNGNALDRPGRETKVPQGLCRGMLHSHQGDAVLQTYWTSPAPLDPASRPGFFVSVARRVMRGNGRSIRHTQRLHKTTNAGQADTSGRTLPLLQCQICRRV